VVTMRLAGAVGIAAARFVRIAIQKP